MNRRLIIAAFSFFLLNFSNPLGDPADPIIKFYAAFNAKDSLMLLDALSPGGQKEFITLIAHAGGFKGFFAMNEVLEMKVKILKVRRYKPGGDTAMVTTLATGIKDGKKVSDTINTKVMKEKGDIWKIFDLKSSMKKTVH